MHWMTVAGPVLAFVGAVLSVIGGQKDGEKDKKEVIGSVTESRDELKKQNEQQQKSLEGISATNETLLKANEGLRDQISIYQDDLTSKQKEINELKTGLEHTALYKAYATYEPNGRQALGRASTSTEVAEAMVGLMIQGEKDATGGFNISIVQDVALFDKANELVRKFPYWAYGYYVRHYHYIMRNDRVAAKKDLEKFVEILEIYVKFPEHLDFNEKLIAKMKEIIRTNSF